VKVNQMLEAALSYARRGWPVFPCQQGGKTPLTHHGFKDASTDSGVIKNWWHRWPSANVAVATGAVSGIIVLDVDGPEGPESFESLGGTPPTPMVHTANGGRHYYLKHPGGRVSNFTKRLPGLDLRGDGGYVVAPPSALGNGKDYTWIIPPEKEEPAEPRRTLLDLITNGRGPAPKIPERIVEGVRNDTLTSLAGAMRRRGASEKTILVALTEENERCDPPLDEGELRTIAKSVGRYKPAINEKRSSKKIETPTGLTLADLRSKIGPIKWAWPKWLPEGFLTVLAGESGTGKSALALRIAGCYLCGWSWPDGTEFNGKESKVLWCETEASQAITLERTKDWGLPENKILTPLDDLADVELDNENHLARIEHFAKLADVRLIVTDSLSGGTHREEGRSDKMIPILKWFSALARDTGKPILLTHHLRKKSIFDTTEVNLERLRGSSGIGQIARVVWAIDTPDINSSEHRRLSVIKNNLTRFAPPIGMTVNDAGVIFDAAPEKPKQETQLDKACDFLLSILDKEPKPATEIFDEGKNAGLSEHTIRRAKEHLGIAAIKREGRWIWGLSTKQ